MRLSKQPPAEPRRWGAALLAAIVVGSLSVELGRSAVIEQSASLAATTATRPVSTSEPPAVDEAARWRWPVDGVAVVTRGFAPPPRPWLAGHRGVDLGGEVGGVIRAAGPGVVIFAGEIAGRGVVSVGHAGGLRTTYEPVTATVRAGATVEAGAVLGHLRPGHACSPGDAVSCEPPAVLHWGLRRGEVYLNPLVLVRPVRVRLKPV